MGSRLKVMRLLLQDGSLDGLLTVEDSVWNNGTLLSCPRENIGKLLEQEEVNRYGIYLLLSDKKVYVGQSTLLKKRIENHILGKDWWERAIILTMRDDSLNKSDIDYLESVLIDKSFECNTLDTDNKKEGNKQKVDKFRKAELDEYLDEALFILELIGVNVFSKNNKKNNLVKTVPTNPESKIEMRSKSETLKFIKDNNFDFGDAYVSYAKKQDKRDLYWNNASSKETKNDWYLVLNNQIDHEIIVLYLPKGSFETSLTPQTGKITIRKDRQNYLDINIDSNTLIEKRSKINFSRFIVKKINY